MARVNPTILKTLRRRKGWSQERLAEMAKVNKQTISRIERGEPENPRENTIKRLAYALGAEPAQLTLEAVTPESGHSDPVRKTRPSGFGVSKNANNFLYLISERYFVRRWQVMELAPLLFCWAAEMSLRERRRRLTRLEEACQAARVLEKEMPHLPPPNFIYSEEKIAAESRSIDAHDIFGMCFGDDDFSEGPSHSLGDDEDNPFAVFLAKLVEQISDVATFEGFSRLIIPASRFVAKKPWRWSVETKRWQTASCPAWWISTRCQRIFKALSAERRTAPRGSRRRPTDLCAHT